MSRNQGTPTVSTPDGSPSNVPLNTTVPNRLDTKSVTSTGTSQSFEVGEFAQSCELVSLLTNGSVIYLKYGYGEAETASDSDFDQLLNPGDRIQVGYTPDVTHISYVGAGELKLIER